MRRILVIVALLAPLPLIPAAVAPVAAAGNCNAAYVNLYPNAFSGTPRTLCYGLNTANGDRDIESEPGAVIGPDSINHFWNDFDSSSSQSGISSARIYGNDSNKIACIYSGKDYSGTLLGSLQGSGDTANWYGSAWDNLAGSIHFYTANFCPS